ncbi:MAG: PhoH family protein [Phycisphaerales bacterium]|nr:PhoH family protein [Phycisphaerales bacterium]
MIDSGKEALEVSTLVRRSSDADPGSSTKSPKGAASPNEAAKTKLKKHFVLDTNVLLHNPGSLFKFEEHEVIVPLAVIEELDTFKKNNDENGRNARHVIRALDKLRASGLLLQGVVWNDQGGSIRVAQIDSTYSLPLDQSKPDHQIIGVAHALHKRGERAIFVSKDINARVKCDALGVPAEDFEHDRVDADWLYLGYVHMQVPGELIDALYDERQLPLERLEPYATTNPDGTETENAEIVANQFVVLQDEVDPSHTGVGRRLADTLHIIPVTGPRKPVYGVLARNLQQTMALDLLLDDEVKIITMIGPAGTGKTLLAIAAGLQKVVREERFDKMLVARPIMPLGRDIGYLPGDKDEKLALWMQPIFDNVSYLLSTRGGSTGEPESKSTEHRIDQLLTSGKLVLEPITYIRGRSIPHQFFVVDEAQNLSPHEVKTIVSRVGDGTKIVLCGDIGQIDNPYLDAASNGLAHTIERMKGQRIAGHVTLAKTERSELASLAAEIL